MLTLGEYLTEPDSTNTLTTPATPPPIHPQTPEDTPQLPHYVHFIHNLGLNQHYVYSMNLDANPPTMPYGWNLEATPFMDLSPSQSMLTTKP